MAWKKCEMAHKWPEMPWNWQAQKKFANVLPVIIRRNRRKSSMWSWMAQAIAHIFFSLLLPFSPSQKENFIILHKRGANDYYDTELYDFSSCQVTLCVIFFARLRHIKNHFYYLFLLLEAKGKNTKKSSMKKNLISC